MESYLNALYQELRDPDYAATNLSGKLDQFDASHKFFLETEIKCLELMLSDGDLEPIIIIGDYKRTDISGLTDAEIDYIKDRLAVEKEPFLVARYAHLLYRKTRDNRYATKAIPAYRELATEYLHQLETKAKNNIDFMDMVEAYALLSLTIKYETQACIDQLIAWYERPEQDPFYYQCFMQLMADSKLFKPLVVAGFTAKALIYVHQLPYGFEAEDYLNACLALGKKEHANLAPIYLLMAENQLGLAEKRPDETGLIKADCYLKASQYFKKAKYNQRADETLRLLNAHKKHIKLGHVTVERDVSDMRLVAAEIADYMLHTQPRTVFIVLAIDQNLLPDISKYKPSPDAAFLNSVRTSAYDINGNTQVLNDFEKKRRDIFMEVQLGIELFIPFLIQELVKKMKDSDRDLVKEGLDFFNHSWLQNELAKNGLGDEQYTYRWMTSLKPALETLIRVNAQDERERLLAPQEQMAFDQLAVKFEGLLRDLCEMAGLTTTKVREEQTVNKDINELLQSQDLSTVFQKKDLDFWLYAFTACGYNIRNNVAHAFYRDHNYTVNLSNILLVAYVRLAKYNDILRRALDSRTNDQSEKA